MNKSASQLTSFRLKIIIRLTPLLFILILIRLFYWQIIRGPQLATKANRQHQETTLLQAKRGDIYDREGRLLAGTRQLYHLYVYKPQLEKETQEVVDLLSPLLAPPPPVASPGAEILTPEDMIDQTEEFLEERFSLSSNWVSLKHYLTEEQKEAINSLSVVGLGLENEFIRYYPEASLSAHLLGFVGKDLAGQEQGYFGLEGFFDRQLKGRSGKVRTEKDAYGNPILIGQYSFLQSQSGRSLVTTIDKTEQFLIERALKLGVERYGAKKGSVIVLETQTGQVRVMANYPTYHPGKFSDYDSSLYKNPIVADLFEPGSVFKPLIMAATLNEDLIEPDTICDICTGPIIIGEYTIKTWDEVYHPNSTMTEVIVNSDNTGMVFVARKLGAEKMVEYFQKYGLDDLTGIQLQEETTGNLKESSRMAPTDLATNSFGQGIAITRLQLITAFNALANSGNLVYPTLIQSVDQVPSSQPKTHSVISSETSHQITQILIEAVDRGEAKWAKPEGISIAGKTGTAQIPIGGTYDPEKTITSFIGFFPAQQPKYTMLVTLTEPQTSPWGSETAAPLWFDIVKQLLL